MGSPAISSSEPRYQPVRTLAKGGMGEVEVVLRREGRFARLYALKRLRSIYAEDPEVRAMFMEEARIAGLIRHANVVSVLDTGEDDGGPFLVMDYIEGASLGELRDALRERQVALPVALALDIVRQTAAGLHAAHELVGPDGIALDVVHRDVSPQNVLIGFDGIVRVTDFGVARALDRLTQTDHGVLKGKMGYMSPEQLRYDPLDRRSDLFALGVMLHELLSGKRLYVGDRPAVFRRILKEPAPPIPREELPPGVRRLVSELLAKAPEQRPATGREVADRLEHELSALSGPGRGLSLAAFLDEHLRDRREEARAWTARALSDGSSAGVQGAASAPGAAPARPVAAHTRRRPPLAAMIAGLGALAAGAVALTLAIVLTGSPTEAEGAEERAPAASAPAASAPAASAQGLVNVTEPPATGVAAAGAAAGEIPEGSTIASAGEGSSGAEEQASPEALPDGEPAAGGATREATRDPARRRGGGGSARPRPSRAGEGSTDPRPPPRPPSGTRDTPRLGQPAGLRWFGE